MNNKLAAIGGAAFGALVAWAVTADYYDQRLKEKDSYISAIHRRNFERANARLQELTDTEREADANARLGREIQTPETEIETAEKPPESDSGEVDDAGGDKDTDDLTDEDPETTRTNLQNLINNYTADSDAQEEFVNRATTVMASEQRPPFVIDRQTFSWDAEEGDEYDKVTITYYPRERIAIDEDDDTVDIADVLGWKNLNQFGGESGDPDTVFIRNRRLSTDYEVVREEDEQPPLHVRYGMDKEEFNTRKAAGTLRLREEDQ